jgi:regulatory protein
VRDTDNVLDTENRIQHALELAYAYLNTRERTAAEVRRRLEQRGVEAAAMEAAVASLVDQGMLDDARFARLFVEDKRGLELWGNERIRRTLRERGIDRDLIEQSLRLDQEETELDRALGLLRRRFPEPPRDRRERDRALGVLVRKGYDSELALDALAAHAREASDR